MRLIPRRCLIPDLLAARGWKQRQLAEHSGIDEKTISKYATNRLKEMPLSIAIPIAEALDVKERMLYEWALDE